MTDPTTASAVVDLAAFAANLDQLRAVSAPAELMVVVKADGYGHGMVPMALAARQAGVSWLGVATSEEALLLRDSGDRGRLLCWLYGPAVDLTRAVAADVDLGVSSLAELARIVAAAELVGATARVHLKIDTGLHRNGCPPDAFGQLCAATREAVGAGAVSCVGVWTHLAVAEEPDHPSVAAQLTELDHGVRIAREAGLQPQLVHAANSAGALGVPASRLDLVRVGIAAYGVDPAPGVAARAQVVLQPVMTVRAQLVSVKPCAAGEGVSYGHTWTAERDTVLGLVPLGYADGLPRVAGNRAEVVVNGRRVPLVGVVCMDQCLVDLGPGATDRVGDEVIIFGAGGPSADELGRVCDTIGYEIVTRVGPRVTRQLQPRPTGGD
ncbi:alanine racemase [Propionibacteriaceae bacterium Y2011]|uniref:alanine racemase n=1 Tax=Microlunatus sp. Y2014 TaxID=3418488 RepID=UPI003B44830D